MHLSMLNPRGKGEGFGHGMGFWHFKKIQILHPREKIIGQNPHLAKVKVLKCPSNLDHVRSKSVPWGQTSPSNSRGRVFPWLARTPPPPRPGLTLISALWWKDFSLFWSRDNAPSASSHQHLSSTYYEKGHWISMVPVALLFFKMEFIHVENVSDQLFLRKITQSM